MQGERNDKNRNASSERRRREEVTKAHLKGPKKNLADPEDSSGSSGSYGLSDSSGSSVKKRKKSQPDLESGRLKEREVQKKIEASDQPTLGWLQASSLSRPLQLPLQAPSPGSRVTPPLHKQANKRMSEQP